MKKKILLSPLLLIALIALFGVGVAGAAIYFGTSSGGETNTEGVNLQKGLVGHWKFDGNTKDSTANSNHGTVTGATLTTDRKGQVNKAYSFDGTSNYIDMGDVNAFDFGINNFTIGIWIKPLGETVDWNYQNPILSKGTYSDGFVLWNENGSLAFAIDSSLGIVKGGDFTSLLDKWTYIVAKRDDNVVYLYIDGEQVDSDPTDDTVVVGNASSFLMGKLNNYFNGLLDDVRIYNRALSQTEITALYQEYDPGIQVSDLQKGLVGQWKFDGNAKDSTANSNHGTVTGATLTTDRKGQVNKAYSFDGDGDYVSLGNPSSLQIANTVTIEGWIWLTSEPGSNVHAWFGNGYNQAGSIFIGTHKAVPNQWWVMLLGPQEFAFGTKVFNAWTHLVITLDLNLGSNQLKAYQNGVLVKQMNWTSDIMTISATRYIGFGSTGNKWHGLIDDVRIYNRALSSAEISALYQEYDPGIVVSDLQKGLVGNWKFDGNAKDSTANSKHGTVTGATLTTDRKGQVNKAYSFDGIDDYIVAGNIGIPQNGPATFSGWFYLTQDAMSKGSGNHNYLWGAHAPGTGEDAILLQHTANNYLYMSGADYFIAPLPLNQWLHIVLTYSGDTSTAKLYVNNVSYAMNLQAGASNISALTSFRISSYYSTANLAWSGFIDDVRVYNRVLSQAEITALYESY